MRPIYRPCGETGKDPQILAFNNAVQSLIAAAAEMKEHLDLADALLVAEKHGLVDAIERLAGQEEALVAAARRLVAADTALAAMRAAKKAPGPEQGRDN